MIPVLSLLLVLCISSPFAYAINSTTESKDACSGHRETLPFSRRSHTAWLPLNHRHGPCSPLPSSSNIPSTSDVLRRDRLRADGIILERKHGSKQEESIPTTLGRSLHSLEYVVTVGLGTPAVNQTVHIDTGSDVSWVQCRRCPVPPCHRQKDVLFDPARSATYSPVRCGSAACRDLRDYAADGCSSSSRGRRTRACQYVVRYADGSNTTGTYSSDKLSLTPAYAVDGFLFGCGHEDQLFGADLAAGIMGLGGGKPSLVSQVSAEKKAFSYCLPPSSSYSGFLTLGADASSSGSSSSFVTTPMYKLTQEVDTFYVVNLQAIVVAGRRVPVAPSVFANGTIMDSGTVITSLPPKAYRALRAAFRREMRMYRRRRASSSDDMVFDTCYNLTGLDDDVKVPSVALVFEGGATVELDRSGIIFHGCLAFTSGTGGDASVGIIGNVQQRTIEVLYDIGGGVVGFRPGAC